MREADILDEFDRWHRTTTTNPGPTAAFVAGWRAAIVFVQGEVDAMGERAENRGRHRAHGGDETPDWTCPICRSQGVTR